MNKAAPPNLPKREEEKPSVTQLDRSKCPALLILQDERSEEYLQVKPAPSNGR